MRRPNFDFVGRSRLWVIVSGTLLVVSVFGLVGPKLDLSIDFRGGTSFVLDGLGNAEVTAAELRETAQEAGATDVKAQVTTDGDRATGALVQMEEMEPGSPEEQAVRGALEELTRSQETQVTFVGPTWGDRISRKALQALIVFLIVVVIYISVRLEPKMAGAAVLALIHDLTLTAGIYALVGFTVSPATVIAILTIMGYSLYDTVVVFDRIEEVTPRLGQAGMRTYGDLVNGAMNDVMWRSLNTSMTSLLPVGSLLFLGAQLLGAATLQDLALALFIGMATGTYSSLFVAGPFLAWWREREPEMAKLRTKAERRRAADEAEAEREAETVSGTAAPRTAVKTEDGELPGYVRGTGRKSRRQRRGGG
ncbi:MAG: protein translocase subunit SecF [Actinobacteria bacterium]|nr:protein translocase subunit SecF [Actinomycetota bacterium]